jgi:putative oxidoreductase
MTQSRLWNAAKYIAAWIAVAILVFGFTRAGLSKLGHSGAWVTAFRYWGYPDWFRVTIGIVEVSAALLLLWPSSSPIGAVLIICVMVGAEATHIVKDHGQHMSSEVVPLALAAVVIVTRRHQARALLARGVAATEMI